MRVWHCRALVDAALANGGRDNVTVVVLCAPAAAEIFAVTDIPALGRGC